MALPMEPHLRVSRKQTRVWIENIGGKTTAAEKIKASFSVKNISSP